MQLTTVFALWTSVVAILLSIFALADNQWPQQVDKATFGKRAVAVFFYILTIIFASLTLWETWKAAGFAGSGGGSVGSF